MVREKLASLKKDDGFQLRGKGATRIEALSDAVFAIAIALLLISADTPESYDELKLFLYDFIPFGATIAILMVIWYQHYTFFLRYGLQDIKTVTINTILLFLILYYVYPLKFLFRTLYDLFRFDFTGNREGLEYLFANTIRAEDGPNLMVIYGMGGVMIFLVLAALYWRAWLLRDKLELNEIERFDTMASIRLNVMQAIIPFISVLIAGFRIGGNDSFMFAGITYWLYPIVMPIVGTWVGKKRKKLFSDE